MTKGPEPPQSVHRNPITRGAGRHKKIILQTMVRSTIHKIHAFVQTPGDDLGIAPDTRVPSRWVAADEEVRSVGELVSTPRRSDVRPFEAHLHDYTCRWPADRVVREPGRSRIHRRTISQSKERAFGGEANRETRSLSNIREFCAVELTHILKETPRGHVGHKERDERVVPGFDDVAVLECRRKDREDHEGRYA